MPTRSDISVLIADDDEQNTKMLSRILEAGGFGGVIATNDSSAVMGLFQSGSPDVVLLDLTMPPPDGFDLLRQLRSEPAAAGPALVVLTGHEHPAIERRAIDLGADAVVAKTASKDELLERIDGAIASRAAAGA